MNKEQNTDPSFFAIYLVMDTQNICFILEWRVVFTSRTNDK